MELQEIEAERICEGFFHRGWREIQGPTYKVRGEVLCEACAEPHFEMQEQ